MSEILQDHNCGGSTDENNRKTAYEAPVLKRLGSIAEVTQGVAHTAGTDNTVASV
jgi:hypothetical protein